MFRPAEPAVREALRPEREPPLTYPGTSCHPSKEGMGGSRYLEQVMVAITLPWGEN